jgi:hypothetical protein
MNEHPWAYHAAKRAKADLAQVAGAYARACPCRRRWVTQRMRPVTARQRRPTCPARPPAMQGLLKHEGKALYGDRYKAWQTAPADFEIDGHSPVR